MSPMAAAPTPPSRPSRLRRLAAVSALVLGLPALIACGDQVPIASSTPEGSASQGASTASPQASTTTNPQPTALPTDSTWYPEGSGAAWWSIPLSASGWQATAVEQDGVNQIVRSDGCQLTSQQNLFDPVGGDRAETEAVVTLAVEGYAELGITNLAYTTRDDSTSIRSAESSQNVEMVRMDLSYTGLDGVDYTGVRWFRVFTQTKIPNLLQLSYFCPTDVYDAGALDTLLKDTSVGEADPLDMDD